MKIALLNDTHCGIRNSGDIFLDNAAKFYDEVCRGHEIALWMKRIDYKGNYVIIDDTPDMLKEQERFFIKTNSFIGLTFKDADKAIEILNKQD